MIKKIKISKNRDFSKSSDKYNIIAGAKYKVSSAINCVKDAWPSAYFGVFILDENNKEIKRFIRWINDTNGKFEYHEIIFTAPEKSAYLRIGYKINIETPFTGKVHIEAPIPSDIKLLPAPLTEKENYDDINDYYIPESSSMSRIIKIELGKRESYNRDSRGHNVIAGYNYKVPFKINCRKKEGPSAYFGVFVFDNNSKEIKRFIRWVNDTKGEFVGHEIVFTAPGKAAYITIGFRINIETPYKTDIRIEMQNPDDINILPGPMTIKESYDDINDYRFPPVEELNNKQMDEYEKKIVWLFGSPRSGTTWLSLRLLNNEALLHWTEPDIGILFGHGNENESTNEVLSKRRLDGQNYRPSYILSSHQSRNWTNIIRRFLISAAYSWSRDTSKHLVVKEVFGQGADIIMKCLPNSKMIFLIRDGRDTVESSLDANTPGSWHGYCEDVSTKEKRTKFIKSRSLKWRTCNIYIDKAFSEHPLKLKHFIKYEFLRDDTFNELKKIYDFIGIKISDKNIMEIAEKYSFKNIPPSEKGPGKFNRAATTGGWRNTFSKDEINLMNSIMGETLKKFGYEI